MKRKLKIAKRLVLVIALAATIAPAAAQTSSKAGQLTLVAFMPEMLKLSFNASETVHRNVAINTSESPMIVTTVSTAWWLAPGRAKVVTTTYIKYPAAPVLIALATSPMPRPLAEGSFVGYLPYEFYVSKLVSTTMISETDSMTIMQGKRVSASTTSLSASNSPTNNLPPDTLPTTVTIQVHAVL